LFYENVLFLEMKRARTPPILSILAELDEFYALIRAIIKIAKYESRNR